VTALLDPGFAVLLDEVAEEPVPPLNSLTPDVVRAAYKAQIAALGPRELPAVKRTDLVIATRGGQIGGRLYTPPEAETLSAGLIYFHGGGFVLGDLDTHDAHCCGLAHEASVRVLSVEYRLAPEHPFPSAHDDAIDATRWVFDHHAELGLDPGRIAIGGDSAGGNLAASVALDLKDQQSCRPAFQLLLYPAIGPEGETASRRDLDGPILTKAAIAWFEELLSAGGHPEIRRLNLGSRPDLGGAPPALIVTAGHDPLKDEAGDYALRLRAQGVPSIYEEYGSLVHDFFVMPAASPEVAKALTRTARRLRDALR
jgi:acetyl esterase